jgi:hypothetical protein
MKTELLSLLICSCALTSCAPRRPSQVVPLSWEFGRDRYLSTDYLTGTPGATCEDRLGEHRLRAPLPDGTYFAIFVRPSSAYPEPWVTLERGIAPARFVQGLSLNPMAGIVEGFDRGENKAYGIRTIEAQWLAQLGRDALAVACAAR